MSTRAAPAPARLPPGEQHDRYPAHSSRSQAQVASLRVKPPACPAPRGAADVTVTAVRLLWFAGGGREAHEEDVRTAHRATIVYLGRVIPEGRFLIALPIRMVATQHWYNDLPTSAVGQCTVRYTIPGVFIKNYEVIIRGSISRQGATTRKIWE